LARQRELWVHPGVPATSLGALVTSLGAPVTRLEAPQITLEQSGKNIFFGNAAGAPGILQVRLEWFRCAWNGSGAPGMLQVRLECCRCAWNAAGAPGIRQVCLEIIATTYCSTIVKTHVFRLYSHLCINVSMYLYSYPSIHGISALAAGGA